MSSLESIKTGDLVYLPAELTLLKFNEQGYHPTHHRKTTEPCCALLVAKDDTEVYHKILYEGQCWSVPKHYVKSMRKEDDNIAS